MVAGHGLKGGMPESTGHLLHPDIMRFNLFGPIMFVPPNPSKIVGAVV